LHSSKNDGIKVKSFLEDCGFTVYLSHDKDRFGIKGEFHTIIQRVKHKLENNEKILLFVYYSGHGLIEDV